MQTEFEFHSNQKYEYVAVKNKQDSNIWNFVFTYKISML